MTAVKRVLEADRLNYVPAEGYLLFVTDTNLIYAGDGSTAGGILMGNIEFATSTTVVISGGPSLSTSTVQDIVGNLLTDGTYDGISFTYDDINKIVTGVVNDTSLTGTFTGDLTGSVFANDSTLLVDGLTGDIFASEITSVRVLTDFIVTNDGNEVTVSNETSGQETTLKVKTPESKSNLKLTRSSSNDISADDAEYGAILFERDDLNGPLSTAFIVAKKDKIFFGSDSTGSFPTSNLVTLNENGQFGIGTFDPGARLDVQGEIVATGFVQFGSLTTTERNALTAANGMVIYNTTNNKFEGYQNGGWINLDDGLAAS